MSQQHSQERVVVAHTAGTTAEALVIRGLLESEAIGSPGSFSTDPFPLREPPEGTHGVEIYVLEWQAEKARRIIEEHLKKDRSDSSMGQRGHRHLVDDREHQGWEAVPMCEQDRVDLGSGDHRKSCLVYGSGLRLKGPDRKIGAARFTADMRAALPRVGR